MQVKLKNVCTVITDGSHSSPVGIEKGYPMLSVKDMRSMGFDYSDCKFISKKDYDILVRNGCKPQINDVLIAKDGSYLKEVFVIKEDIDQVILSSIAILRPDTSRINPYFLKFYLQTESVKEIVTSKYVSGSALQRIILKNFKEIEIDLPDRPTQDKIVEILSNIDSQIERNNEITKSLQVLAQSTYSRWFNQFEFPNEEGLPYKSNGGKFEYNEELKRKIPIGWEVKELDDILEESDKSKVQVSDAKTNSGKVPFFTSGEEIILYKDAFVDGPYCYLNTGGNADVKFFEGKSSYSTDTWCISFDKYTYMMKEYLLFIKPSMDKLFFSGSGLKHLQKEVFKKQKILIPDDDVLNQFNKIVEVCNKQSSQLYLQNIELNNLKSKLLPLLINGQLEI